jgi:hypothetical protein
LTVHRVINRRSDPLRRRTLDDWSKAFAKFTVLTDAVVCAARKVAWDYPYTGPVTNRFSSLYRQIVKLPPPAAVERALLRLGYHPVQAYRAAGTWGQTEVNTYERHLCSLVPPAYRDDTEGSVSINLPLETKTPGNS